MIIPTVVAVAVIVLSTLPNGQKGAKRISWRTVLPVFALQLLSYLVLAKQPYIRYFFTLGLSFGLNLVLLYYAFQPARSITKRAIGSLTLIGLLFLALQDLVPDMPPTYEELRDDRTKLVHVYKHARDITKDDVRIDYFFSDSPEYPLFSANLTTGRAFSSLLTRLYPKPPLFYNYSDYTLETFIGPVDTETVLQRYGHLYFLGDTRFFPKLKGIEPDRLETIESVGTYSLQKWTRK